MVNVPRLQHAIEALVWRQGGVRGNEVRHRFEPDGARVITITVPAAIIDPDSLPKPKTVGPMPMVTATTSVGKYLGQ
jgi:hypothetical protein